MFILACEMKEWKENNLNTFNVIMIHNRTVHLKRKIWSFIHSHVVPNLCFLNGFNQIIFMDEKAQIFQNIFYYVVQKKENQKGLIQHEGE